MGAGEKKDDRPPLRVGHGGAPTAAPLDLMVDDLEETHARWSARGLPVSPIEHGAIHETFTLTDPEDTW
jgi:hypothetical protein